VQRQELGSFVHIFTHIRQTQLVDLVTLTVERPEALRQLLQRSGGEAGGGRVCKWVRLPELQAGGISTGVRKALKLVAGAAGGKKRKAA
jgi:hypothetical protein